MFSNESIYSTLTRYPFLLLYDHHCGMCQHSVQFILKHNPKKNIHFLGLDSDLGKELLLYFDLKNIDSIIYVEHGRAYYYAQSIFKCSLQLSYPWKLLYIFSFLPHWITAPPYKFIAKHRRKFDKKFNQCPIYSKEIKERFIDPFT